MGQVQFVVGSTNYFLPPPSGASFVPLQTWRDHASMNETIWRDFTFLTKRRQFTLRWDGLRPAEFLVARSVWDRFMMGSTMTYVDFLTATQWSVSPDVSTFEFKYTAYTGKLGSASTFEVLYQVTLIFRGHSNQNYTLP